MRCMIGAHYIERTTACHNFLLSGGSRANAHVGNRLRQSPNENKGSQYESKPPPLSLALDLPSRSLPTIPRWHKACSGT